MSGIQIRQKLSFGCMILQNLLTEIKLVSRWELARVKKCIWNQTVGQHRAVPVRGGAWDRMEQDEVGWQSTQDVQP